MRDFGNLSPEDYWKIFWRRKWYFLFTLLVVSAGAAVYAFQMPLIYRSETTIMVEGALMPEDYVRSAVRSSPAERINAIRLQVQSRKFLEQIVQEFQLFGYGSGASFNMENATAALAGNVKIENMPGGAFKLSYAALEPQAARDITRRLASALIQSNQAARRLRAVETDQFLESQLRQTERDLNAQEEKIKQFKMIHLGQLPEQGAANLNVLSGLQTQLAAAENSLQYAREQRKLLDFRLQEQKQLDAFSQKLFQEEPSPGLETSAPAASASNPQLEQKKALLADLSAKYTPKHPDVVRLTLEVRDIERRQALERQRAGESRAENTTSLTPLGQSGATAAQAEPPGIAGDLGGMLDIVATQVQMEVERADSEIARKEKERAEIAQQMKVIQGRLNLAPALEQELLALTRDHQVLRQQYTSLQGKKFQSQMSASLETDTRNETYRIIDEANLPAGSTFPNRLQIILMGIGAGFLVGLGAAFGREYLDPTLRSEEEVTEALGLPVLIAIPELPRQRTRKRLLGIRGTT